jgi:hypothetical chaperone protein
MVKVLKYTLDFGTSNTLLGAVTELGSVPTIPLDFKNDENSHILKSLIYTPNDHEWYYGSECYDKYLECEGEGRFFRSFKTLLSRESFEGTMIHGKRVGVVELVARFLREARHRANSFYQQDVTSVRVGRPVRFGETRRSDELALKRLGQALKLAGFIEIDFVYEPVAAAKSIKQTFDEEKLVLVADIGGGTSDFSIIKMKNNNFSEEDILAVGGVNVAGDSFDFSLMKNFVMPELGSRVTYRKSGSNVDHGISRVLLDKLCSPSIFSLINDTDIAKFLEDALEEVDCSIDQQRLENLENLFEEKLGFDLMKEIELKKIKLSKSGLEKISYQKKGISIASSIERQSFDESSQGMVEKIERALDQVFEESGKSREDIDFVISTGGGMNNTSIIKMLNNKGLDDSKLNLQTFKAVVSGLS